MKINPKNHLGGKKDRNLESISKDDIEEYIRNNL